MFCYSELLRAADISLLLQNAPPALFIFAERTAGGQELAELVRPIAEKYKGELRVATVDTINSANLVSNFFRADFLTLAIMHQRQIFLIDERIALTRDSIEAWAEEFLAGNLTPHKEAGGATEKSVDGRAIVDAWRSEGGKKDEL